MSDVTEVLEPVPPDESEFRDWQTKQIIADLQAKLTAKDAKIEALRNELRRLQSVVCEEDYDIITTLLEEAGE